jgi:hypothetical protein
MLGYVGLEFKLTPLVRIIAKGNVLLIIYPTIYPTISPSVNQLVPFDLSNLPSLFNLSNQYNDSINSSFLSPTLHSKLTIPLLDKVFSIT